MFGVRMWARKSVGVWCAGLAAVFPGAVGPAQCPVTKPPAAVHQAQSSTVLVDRATGQSWTFSDEKQLPGAPRRLLRKDLLPGNGSGTEGASGRKPVIRAGDRLEAVDCSTGVDVHLEVIALEPASVGERLRVRTRAFGATLSAFALARGEVLLAPGAER